MALTPNDAAQRGRLGALKLHATHDPRETTRNGRAAFLKRFEDEVDPERVLPEGERLRRAEYARKFYFSQLAYKSAKARRMRKAGADTPARSQEVEYAPTPADSNFSPNSEDAGGTPASCKEADRGTDRFLD